MWPSEQRIWNVSSTTLRSTSRRAALVAADQQGELGHLPPQLGDDPLGDRRADAGQRGQALGILFFDQDRDVSHRPDHRPARPCWTPTPSTEQNSSKNSRSTSFRKPTSRGTTRP